MTTLSTISKLEEILMVRDHIGLMDAREQINIAAEENPHDPEAALYDLGLEPDYVFDILEYYR